MARQQRRIGTALVGTGQGARENYAPLILQSRGFRLRALWSRTQASAERFNLEVAGCSLEVFHGEEGFQRLLARSDIEGYAVALPPPVQSAYVFRLLSSRRHVFSERPVALSREGAEQTLRLLEEQLKEDRRIWFIADHLKYEPVFHPSHIKLHELGPILAAEVYCVLVVQRQGSSPLKSPVGGRDEDLGGDDALWIEGGVQYISVLRQLFGQITEVNCVRVSDPQQRDMQVADATMAQDAGACADSGAGASFWKDALSGTLRFEAGAVVALNWQTSDSRQDERFCITIWGANGTTTVELDMGAQAFAVGLRRYTMHRSLSPMGAPGQPPAGTHALPHTFPAMGAERQLEAWGDAIRAYRGSGSSSSGPRCAPSREGGHTPVEEGDPTALNHGASLNAIVDLMVVSAMLQSRGTTVQIRERQKAATQWSPWQHE